MRKNRGQSLIEFVGIAILAVGIIIFGLYKYGDKLADFFAGNNPDSKFNASRTVKFENPQDLVSNVTVNFNGTSIQPPVEKIIKAGLASGNYIQTSGSAGRIAQMGDIIKEYANQIQALITAQPVGSVPTRTAFTTALGNYINGSGSDQGVNDFTTDFGTYSANQILEQKLKMIEMAASLGSTNLGTNLQTAFDAYKATLPVGHEKDIIETFTNDMLNLNKGLDYFMDPTLYTSYLNKVKEEGNLEEDLDLVSAIQAKLGIMTQAEKDNAAGLLKIYYGSGYSQISPTAYNGERMCSTFGGTLVGTTCTITP